MQTLLIILDESNTIIKTWRMSIIINEIANYYKKK